MVANRLIQKQNGRCTRQNGGADHDGIRADLRKEQTEQTNAKKNQRNGHFKFFFNRQIGNLSSIHGFIFPSVVISFHPFAQKKTPQIHAGFSFYGFGPFSIQLK